jgi:hypothetical protein
MSPVATRYVAAYVKGSLDGVSKLLNAASPETRFRWHALS